MSAWEPACTVSSYHAISNLLTEVSYGIQHFPYTQDEDSVEHPRC